MPANLLLNIPGFAKNNLCILVLDYRSRLSGSDFAILLLPCPFMMNTAMTFWTCPKVPAFLGCGISVFLIQLKVTFMQIFSLMNLHFWHF